MPFVLLSLIRARYKWLHLDLLLLIATSAAPSQTILATVNKSPRPHESHGRVRNSELLFRVVVVVT